VPIDHGTETVVSADSSQTWRYGKIMTGAGIILSPLIALCAAAADAVHGVAGVAGLAAVGLLLMMAMAFGMGVLWRMRSAKVAYLVDDRGLRVTRGTKVIRQIDRDQIASFKIVGKMDVRECLFGATPPPPSWPYGVVGLVDDGEELRIFPNALLPEIMIWGRAEVRAAEWKIQKALRATGPLRY
jgi:hypothetical protein